MILSIVIPSFNSYESTLKITESLINQDLKDVEIIVVNDGSKTKYGKFPNHVIYIDKRNNSGAVESRMKGWEKSTGKYIWFFDGDDEITKGSIKRIKEILNNEDLYVFPMVKEFKNGKKKVFPFKIKDNKVETTGYSSYFGDKIFKSSLINKNMFDIKSEIFQDENFILRFGSKAKSVSVIKNIEPISCYLYNFGSVSKNHTTKKQVLKLVNNVVSLIPFIDKLEDSKFKIKARKQMTRMLTIARGWSLKLNREERREVVSKIREIKKNHKKVFGFIFNYSTAYHLIAFVNIMGWV